MISKKVKKLNKVLVVVHDAGGAEIIGAYVRKHQRKAEFCAYGSGPAKNVFKRLKLPLRPIKDTSASIHAVIQRHTDAAYVLVAAPGWMTKIEVRALAAAKRAGLKTIVYMDSWVDERKRFGYPEKNWRRNLPDEFWAGDRYALSNLKKRIPDVLVRLVPNQYSKDNINRYRTLKKMAKPPTSILFASRIGSESCELLEHLLHLLAKKRKKPHLLIRYHPGDEPNGYKALIRGFENRVQITVSREKELVKDLLRARVVIGTETMALAIAVCCGIRTISYLKKGVKGVLPFKRINQIARLSLLERLI